MIEGLFRSFNYCYFDNHDGTFKTKPLNFFHRVSRNIFGLYPETHAINVARKAVEYLAYCNEPIDVAVKPLIDKVMIACSPKIANFELYFLYETLFRWRDNPRVLGRKEAAFLNILAFVQDPKATNLQLKGLELTDIPDIFRFNIVSAKLTSLDLSQNQLSSLPDSIGQLTKLKYLNVSENELTFLPNSMGMMTNLDTLMLQNNGLESIPDTIGLLANLTYLNGSVNKLSMLPDTIGSLIRLSHLTLTSNRLTILPDAIGNLEALSSLKVDENLLNDLPDAIGNLKALEKLSLYHNKLKTLPETIGALTALSEFDCSENYITILPETVGEMKALSDLNLSANVFIALPKSIGQLTALKQLDLEDNDIAALPTSIGDLTALERLSLAGNQLRTLPHTISKLRNLNEMDVSDNARLRSVPIEIMDLPQACTINLAETGLSQAVRTRIGQILRNPFYQGPNFTLPREGQVASFTKSWGELLADLFRLVGEPIEEISLTDDYDEKLTLCSWLYRLSDTADYESGGQAQIEFAKQIIEYLQFAQKDLLFRQILFHVIDDASETCGDRVSLSVMHIDVQYKLALFDLDDMSGLAKFLQGLWALGMLEEIAIQKIPAMPFCDEIEILLAYPIKLKESLALPINITRMRYFHCCELTNEDLQEAETFVKQNLANQQRFHEYLITNHTWEVALTNKFPAEIAAMRNARQNHADSMQALEIYQAQLLVLTDRVLPQT